MEGGPPMFRQDGSCPALLKDLRSGFPYGAVTRSGPPFQTLPVPKTQATGLVRFRSPLLTESRLMSFPPATEMFQFAGFASLPYEFSSGYPRGWVAPFGDPGINDRSHLPRAFRSVPRPSSPLSAKASTRCPYLALERHTQRQRPWSRCTVISDQVIRTDSSAAKLSFSEDTSRGITRHGLSAANGLPLRSHNSLLYDCQSTTHLGAAKQPPRGNSALSAAASISTRSIKLRCRPVEVIGIEPTTPCLQSRCSPS